MAGERDRPDTRHELLVPVDPGDALEHLGAHELGDVCPVVAGKGVGQGRSAGSDDFPSLDVDAGVREEVDVLVEVVPVKVADDQGVHILWIDAAFTQSMPKAPTWLLPSRKAVPLPHSGGIHDAKVEDDVVPLCLQKEGVDVDPQWLSFLQEIDQWA